MLRRLFTILSALSFLLCIGVAALWFRSYFVSDHIFPPGSARIEGPRTSWTLDWLWIGRGRIGFNRVVPSTTHPSLAQRVQKEYESRKPLRHETSQPRYPEFNISGDHTILGFNFSRLDQAETPNRTGVYSIQIIVPLWSLVILFSILPCLQLWRRRVLRKRRCAGHCLTCGYDLRAHKSGDLCPECGTPVPASSRNTKPKIYSLIRPLFTIFSALSLLLFLALMAKCMFLPHTPLAAWSVYADAELHCRCVLLVNGHLVIGEWYGPLQRESWETMKAQRDASEMQARAAEAKGTPADRWHLHWLDQQLKQWPLIAEISPRQAHGLHAGISQTLAQCFSPPNSSVPLLWDLAGMRYYLYSYSTPYSSYRTLFRRLAIPIWMIAALLLLAPLRRAFTIVRAIHRRRHGLCPTCSYDLRAHLPGDLCPECGTPIRP